MKFEVIKKCCSLYRLDENREVPRAIYYSSFFSVTRTDKELSIICDSDVDLSCGVKVNDLRLFRVVGSLGFNTTGIISSVSKTLSSNDICFFALSTFETDYIIVKSDDFDKTISSMVTDGYEVIYSMDFTF